MPITPAHAAAAWPLHAAWRRLPLAALVIGTLSPDLEYVLRLEPRGKFGHSPAGLVVFCLPVTLLVWYVWRSLVRAALTPLLAPRLPRRCCPPAPAARPGRRRRAGARTCCRWPSSRRCSARPRTSCGTASRT